MVKCEETTLISIEWNRIYRKHQGIDASMKLAQENDGQLM